MKQMSIKAIDGFELAATIFEPTEKPNGAVIVMNSATGVPRKFYRPLARFLSQSGYTVVTYDYRGIGDSRPDSLKGFDARVRDWGELDMASVIDWADATYQPTTLLHIGHSVGGQMAGLLENHHKIDAMVTMSSQSGYWRLQGGSEKLKVLWVMGVMFPLLTRIYGYFPWSRFATGEDLPKGVALEWAKWCRSPNYLYDDKTLTNRHRFLHFSAPILAFSFDDDNWGTEQSVNALMSGYMGAPIKRRHVRPADYGLKSIGHFGFFRPQSKQLWQEMLAWLDNQIKASELGQKLRG